MKTSLLITTFSLLFVLSILFADADARCLEDPCYYYQHPRVIDSSGNTLDFVMVDQQVQITIDVANAEDYEQPFVALIQVVDEDNFPLSLNWISGVLNSGHSFSPATSWIPKKSGYYEATVYLWESLERKIPLSPTMATSIEVMSKNDLRKTRGDLMECKDNLELIQKYDGSHACVKPETQENLKQRGWMMTVHTSEDFAKQSTLDGDQNTVSKMHVLYSVKKPLESFETDSFHFVHYENWDYDFLRKAARYGATYLTDDEKDHYENVLKPNGTNFKITNHKGPSYYEMKLVEETLPVKSHVIKFVEYPSDIIEKYGDEMLSHNLGSTGFDKESKDLWIDAMQKPYEWTEVTERGGAFAYNRIGPGFPYFQMPDSTWVQLYYLGPRMNNHSLFELYVQGYGSEHPLEKFSEKADNYLPGSKVLVRDREGSVSLTISISNWEEHEQFLNDYNSKDYPPPVKITDESMHFVYFDMLLELNTPKGFTETSGRSDEYRKNIGKDYPIDSHREIYDWLRLESGKQYGYSVSGDFSPFFEYRDTLYRISSAIID